MSKKQQQRVLDKAFEEQLNDQSQRLQSALESGDMTAAMQVVGELGSARDQKLYQEVGRLTRSLHESIRNFQIDAQNTEQVEALSKMTDASDRLGYVVEMTSKAANTTLDLVEETMPMASRIKEDAEAIRKDWARLRRREMKPAEFRDLYGRIDLFLDRLSSDADKVYASLSNILMAQDFQDLTGQVIAKVTNLVKEVEESLVGLVVMAGSVDQLTGIVHEGLEKNTAPADSLQGEGPQMHAQEREDTVSSQDDVDDLLSSLGF